MIKFLRRLVLPLLLLAVWVVMNEGGSIANVVTGICVTAFSIFATGQLLDFDYLKIFSLPPFAFIRYLLFLLKEIYLGGISATIIILTGKTDPAFVTSRINAEIKTVFLHNVLATSITLTPGTITVVNNDGVLTVLSMHGKKQNPAQGFETQLLKIEKSMQKRKD